MQAEKDKNISQALGTDKKNLKAFTIKELLSLFGRPVKEDEQGRPFILVDDEEDPRDETP